MCRKLVDLAYTGGFLVKAFWCGIWDYFPLTAYEKFGYSKTWWYVRYVVILDFIAYRLDQQQALAEWRAGGSVGTPNSALSSCGVSLTTLPITTPTMQSGSLEFTTFTSRPHRSSRCTTPTGQFAFKSCWSLKTSSIWQSGDSKVFC